MKNTVSREDFVRISGATADTIEVMAKRLAELARFMKASPDYTGTVHGHTDGAIAHLPEVLAECKTYAKALKARGAVALDEQIAAVRKANDAKIAEIAKEKAKLTAGKPITMKKRSNTHAIVESYDAAAEE